MVDLAPASNFPPRFGQVWHDDFRVTGGRQQYIPYILFRTAQSSEGLRLNDPAGASGVVRGSTVPFLQATNFVVETRMRLAGSPAANTVFQFCLRRAVAGDYNNRIVLQLNRSSISLVRIQAGASTNLGFYGPVPEDITWGLAMRTYRAECLGNKIYVYVDGILRIAVTEKFLCTGQAHFESNTFDPTNGLADGYVQYWYAEPISYDPGVVSDSFNRADSALVVGQADSGHAWTGTQGTWGISSNQAYSVSDTDGDFRSTDALVANYELTVSTRGQITGANQRWIAPQFRMVDPANFMFLIHSGDGSNMARLFKCVASVFTEIATGPSSEADVNDVDQIFTVRCSGSRITCYRNGVLTISYTLTAPEQATFLTPTLLGWRLYKAGAPTVAARMSYLRALRLS